MKTLLKVIKHLWENEFLFKGFLTYGLLIFAMFAAKYIHDRTFDALHWLIGMFLFVPLAMIVGTWISDRKRF